MLVFDVEIAMPESAMVFVHFVLSFTHVGTVVEVNVPPLTAGSEPEYKTTASPETPEKSKQH